MATRLVLADLANAYRQHSGVEMHIESVGGVDAARRVQAGEAFDIVFLASDAIDRLNEALLTAARSRWPEEWSRISPRGVTLASWVGCDTDGYDARADIETLDVEPQGSRRGPWSRVRIRGDRD
jgi:hypothetical protein